MNTPQSAILPDHAQAAICMEADVIDAKGIQAACCAALDALTTWQNRFPEDVLGLTIAFGADFWQTLNRPNEARELKNFRSLGNGLAPATQHDVLFHIQSKHLDSCFGLARDLVNAFGNSIAIQTETHGFRRHEERGLDDFVDGTENPQGNEEVSRVALIGADQADAQGSYVLLQRYQHHLNKWQQHSIAEQEEAIARSKWDNIEFAKSERHPRSHIARTNLRENGVKLEIVRRSLPYGKASGEHGLMFIAYCARLHNIEAQLLSMFGESADGQTDLLLERLSSAVSGAYYFAPSVERLKHLFNNE